MARLNTRNRNTETTHEGAPAHRINDEQALRRSVLSCLLWEDTFYESGEDIAERIVTLARKVAPTKLAALAVEARQSFNLRHVPLLLVSVLAETGKGSNIVAETIKRVVQRADELTELLAVHAKRNKVTPDKVKHTISAQMKKGLAAAFCKFDEYQLAKYDRDGAIRLRDSLFMVHAKPKDKDQAALWERLVKNELKVPDTWEVALSGGADKKETFERLIKEKNLGYLALLRNLRNMEEAGVDKKLVDEALMARKGAERVFPFRFLSAARAAPRYEPTLDKALKAGLKAMPHFEGTTAVICDCSGSMSMPVSSRSVVRRTDVGGVLAGCINGDEVRLIGFGTRAKELPARPGLATCDVLAQAEPELGSHTNAHLGVEIANKWGVDRMIVISDEQVTEQLPKPKAKHAYVINVGSYKNGIGYGEWTHIDGFSEAVIRFMHEYERFTDETD